MGRGNEVIVFDCQVVDRRSRQVQLQRLPVRAIVGREVHSRLRARVEQALHLGVFAHRSHVSAGGNAVGDASPRLAEVVGLVDQRIEVVQLVAVDRRICRARIVSAKPR